MQRIKQTLIGISAALLGIAAAGDVHAEINFWASHGPESEAILALLVDPATSNYVYAATNHVGGVHRSTDGGISWALMSSGLANVLVSGFAVDFANPATVYANSGCRRRIDDFLCDDTGTPGIFKSTDRGVSWSPMNVGVSTISVTGVLSSPSSPAVLYATAGSLFKSTDAGASWLSLGMPALALAVDPTDSEIVYTSAEDRVLKTTDGGASWMTSGLLRRATLLAVDPTNPATVYAGTVEGVFRTTNGGDSWTPTGLSTAVAQGSVRAFAIDPHASETLYAGGQYGVLRSTDGGASWMPINSGLTGRHVTALALDPAVPNTVYVSVYVGGDGGVFKSTDGGSSWAAMNDGLPHAFFPVVSALAIDPTNPDTVYAGTAGSGTFKSVGGAAWAPINDGLPSSTEVNALAISTGDPSAVYAGTNWYGVFKTSNENHEWTATNIGFPAASVSALAVDPTITSTIYAGTDRAVFTSADAGVSWAVTKSEGLAPGVSSIAIDPSHSSRIYAGTRDYGVFKTEDGGGSWSDASSGLPRLDIFIDSFLPITQLLVDPAMPSTVYVAIIAGDVGTIDASGVYKSTDGGASWAAANIGLPEGDFVQALAIDPTEPATLYAGLAGASRGGVYKTADGGQSWRPMNVGLNGRSISALVVASSNPAVVYAATDSGVFVIEQVTTCTGDCNRDRIVTVDELVKGVMIVLGDAPIGSCPEFACRGTDDIGVDCLIQGVGAALEVCEAR